uniref:Uncharacterized protein n=1 Tax=Tanacetum cinerariifolium TaxID=118510 RepID=A0A6L2MZM7_TANCI|nr:hypothetical protein [Tanacetum cinerariifolium]GEU79421.1 hypothetical protein [Tanacetum cinerariifolium]
MGLNTADNINSLLKPDDEDEEEEYLDCEDNEEYFNHENNEEFTFMYLDENNTPILAYKALKNKDIHPMFPLFDQTLLSHEERKQLPPINPQVNKVFVESDQVALFSTSEYKQPPRLSKKSNSTCFPKLWRLKHKAGCSNSDGRDAFLFLKKPVRTAVEGSSLKGNGGKRKGLKVENGKFSGHKVCLRSMGPFCMWKKQPPKLSKKSNSTWFSKLWRLKDNNVGCSNSDGRDAFVFLKKPVRTAVEGSSLKGNGGKRKAENGKFSGHEVYLRKRAQGEEDRRQSYLPYRLGIMGFFTNVNGGLSKNVYPY